MLPRGWNRAGAALRAGHSPEARFATMLPSWLPAASWPLCLSCRTICTGLMPEHMHVHRIAGRRRCKGEVAQSAPNGQQAEGQQ
jgi:hypothetical protein